MPKVVEKRRNVFKAAAAPFYNTRHGATCSVKEISLNRNKSIQLETIGLTLLEDIGFDEDDEKLIRLWVLKCGEQRTKCMVEKDTNCDVISFCLQSKHGGDKNPWIIDFIYVDPLYRRQSRALKMINELKVKNKESKVYIKTDRIPALNLFCQAGFEIIKIINNLIILTFYRRKEEDMGKDASSESSMEEDAHKSEDDIAENMHQLIIK